MNLHIPFTKSTDNIANTPIRSIVDKMLAPLHRNRVQFDKQQSGVYYAYVAGTDGITMFVSSRKYNDLAEVCPSFIGKMTGEECRDEAYRAVILNNIKPATTFTLFSEHASLQYIEGLEKIDTSRIVNAKNMFYKCGLRDINGAEQWTWKRCRNMKMMFSGCKNLTDISALANWDVSHVDDMSCMFCQSSMENLDALAKWNVSRVRDMSYMFEHCKNLTDVSGIAAWNLESIVYLDFFFSYNIFDVKALWKWHINSYTSLIGMIGKAQVSLPSIFDIPRVEILSFAWDIEEVFGKPPETIGDLAIGYYLTEYDTVAERKKALDAYRRGVPIEDVIA